MEHGRTEQPNIIVSTVPTLQTFDIVKPAQERPFWLSNTAFAIVAAVSLAIFTRLYVVFFNIVSIIYLWQVTIVLNNWGNFLAKDLGMNDVWQDVLTVHGLAVTEAKRTMEGNDMRRIQEFVVLAGQRIALPHVFSFVNKQAQKVKRMAMADQEEKIRVLTRATAAA